jgi:hypothetical protein
MCTLKLLRVVRLVRVVSKCLKLLRREPIWINQILRAVEFYFFKTRLKAEIGRRCPVQLKVTVGD